MQIASPKSEAGFKALFEHSTIAILVVGKNGRIELVNPSAERLFGYAGDELTGKPLETLIPEDLRGKHASHRLSYFHEPKVRPMGLGMDLSARKKDGTVFPVEIGLGHYSSNGGNFAVAFIRDITVEKFSRDKFAGIFHNSPAAIILSENETGKVIEVNDSFCRLVGCTRENLIGKTTVEAGIIDYSQRKMLTDMMQQDGRIFNMELQIKSKKNEPVYILLSSANIEISGEKYLLSNCIDITERKKEREALIKSEARLDAESEWLRFLNKALNRLWKITNMEDGLEEILSTSIKLLNADKGTVQLLDNEKQALVIAAHKGFEKEFLKRFREVTVKTVSVTGIAFSSRKPVVVEDVQKDPLFARYLREYKATGIHAVQSTPLYNHAGLPVGIISTHSVNPGHFKKEDLRRMELYALYAESFLDRMWDHEAIQKINLALEDKVRERTLELTHMLEREKELNELKSRFVSLASHEFRTPLSAILSSVSLIDSYKKSEDEAKRQRHVERIRQSVHNLTGILDDFLSLDKLEQGKISVVPEKFDLKELMEDTLEEMDGMLKKKRQKINFVHNGNAEMLQDKKILRNIVLNLLSNACKYSPEEEEILLTAKSADGKIHISVKDNGIGIPEEEQKNIFSKFYRASNVGGIQGTGLGLNIVHRYIDLLKGKIGFESNAVAGTTFSVELPETIR